MIPYIFLTIGIVGTIISKRELGKGWSVSSLPTTLVTTGIYKYLLHPIYYFSMFTWVGISILLWPGQLIPFIICLTLTQKNRIDYEERCLTEKYGTKYILYRSKTLF